MRMLEGKCVVVVGVAGRILTEAWGERVVKVVVFMEAEPDPWAFVLLVVIEADDVDDALECEWTWWMLRTDDTEEDVDFRPRRPALERRYEDRGVNGEGERELR